MAVTITQISGIGLKTAEILTQHGFNDVAKIAASTVDKLSTVPGFGPARARSIIDAAGILLTGTAASPPAAAGSVKPATPVRSPTATTATGSKTGADKTRNRSASPVKKGSGSKAAGARRSDAEKLRKAKSKQEQQRKQKLEKEKKRKEKLKKEKLRQEKLKKEKLRREKLKKEKLKKEKLKKERLKKEKLRKAKLKKEQLRKEKLKKEKQRREKLKKEKLKKEKLRKEKLRKDKQRKAKPKQGKPGKTKAKPVKAKAGSQQKAKKQ